MLTIRGQISGASIRRRIRCCLGIVLRQRVQQDGGVVDSQGCALQDDQTRAADPLRRPVGRDGVKVEPLATLQRLLAIASRVGAPRRWLKNAWPPRRSM